MICDVYRRGNRKITEYCKDGYVCGSGNKCLPGPEMVRKREEELRRAEEERRRNLAKMQEELKKREQEFKAIQRQYLKNQRRVEMTAFARRNPGNDDMRIPGAQPGQVLLGEGWTLAKPAPAGSAPQSRPVKRPVYSQRSRNTLTRDILHVVIRLSPREREQYLDMLEKIRSGPDGGGPSRDSLDAAIEGLRMDARQRPPVQENSGERTGPVNEAAKPQVPDLPPSPAEPEKRKPPQNEALCSFLMQFETDQPGHLAVSLPDYCQPYKDYLASLAPEAERSKQKMTPLIMTKEDRNEIDRMKAELHDVLPPGLQP